MGISLRYAVTVYIIIQRKRRNKMEYDKSKVYTALNADELKVGSKVISREKY